MKSSTFAVVAIYALVALSMWSPDAQTSYAGMVTMLRYVLFIAASASIIGYAYLARGILISRSPEWVLLIAFLSYVSLSALWSDGGVDAIIKGGLIFSALLVSVSIASIVSLGDVLRIYYKAMGVFVLLSLAVVILFPETGIEKGWLLEGDWKGIAGQKNGLGNIASLVFVASLVLPLQRRFDGRRLFATYGPRLAMVAISGICLVNSGSRGALLSAGIGIGSVLVARAPKALQRLGLVVLVVLAIPVVNLVLATIELSADKIGVLGTTVDTNSRTTLWFYGLEQMNGRELLGFGVGGFWTPERVIAFRDVHGWVLDNFHNGYVTIFVEGGIVGMLLLVFSILFLMLLYLVTIGNVRDTHIALAFGYTNMFLVGNLVENEIGRSTSLTFIMFLILSFSLRTQVSRILAPHPPDVALPAGMPSPRPA